MRATLIVIMIALSSCGTGGIREAGASVAASAAAAATDPSQPVDIAAIEIELAAAKARVAQLDAQRIAAEEAAQRARARQLATIGWAIAGLGFLAAAAGGVVMLLGSRKTGWTLMLCGAGGMVLGVVGATTIPWILAAGPVIGAVIGIVIAGGIAWSAWQHRKAFREVVDAGREAIAHRDIPDRRVRRRIDDEMRSIDRQLARREAQA